MRASVEKRLALPQLERWFQGEVVRQVDRTSASVPAERVILPSAHLAPRERVAIYGGMYFARLLECLREDYPALAKLAGPAQFEKIARAYLRRHPSRHYSLAFLGQDLPAFLRGRVRFPRRALLADVATLERAMSEVFDAPVETSMTPAELALVPPQAWASGRMRLVDALRLCAFDHRANAIVTACRQDKKLPSLGREKTFVAVYRKEWQVWRMDLDRTTFAILSTLRDGGALSEALDAAARSFDGTPEDLQARIYRWFREWATEGLIAAVLPAATRR